MNQVDLNALAARLKDASVRLNNITDELNLAIEKVEMSLRPFNIGLEVWVPVVGPEVGHETIYLGHSNYDGWGLHIRNGGLTDEQTWRFNKAPRRLRLLAVDMLPQLLDALSKRAFEETGHANAALEKVQKMMKGI